VKTLPEALIKKKIKRNGESEAEGRGGKVRRMEKPRTGKRSHNMRTRERTSCNLRVRKKRPSESKHHQGPERRVKRSRMASLRVKAPGQKL